MREKEGTSLNDLKKRLGALALAGWMTLSLAACSVPLGDAEVRTGEDGSLVIDGEAFERVDPESLIDLLDLKLRG